MSAAPEFSRSIAIDTIGGGASHTIEADTSERAALAERFGLQAVTALSAQAEIRRDGCEIFATGSIKAKIVQACVVTDEPVPATIAETFDLRFIPDATSPGSEEEIELSADECETQTYDGNAIDLGEAAAQTMALALDPFPRSANADAALREAGVITEQEAGPFGALKELRNKLAQDRE